MTNKRGILVWEKSPYGALVCTKRTFLQIRNEPHLLKSTPSGPFSRPKIKHLWDFSLFLGPRLQSQFLGWKNAFTPHLIDSDGRTIHKGSKYGPNSKIMKNTQRTFLQTTADLLQSICFQKPRMPDLSSLPFKNWCSNLMIFIDWKARLCDVLCGWVWEGGVSKLLRECFHKKIN